MKSILFAAALGISSVALAQAQQTQQPTTTDDAAPAQPDPAQAQPDAAQPQPNPSPAQPDASAPQAQPDTGPDPDGPTADPNGPNVPPGDGITQQGTDPEGQARTPVGTNQMPSMNPVSPAQAFAPRPATTDYPPCTRTVTDNCIQTYERGVRRSRRGR